MYSTLQENVNFLYKLYLFFEVLSSMYPYYVTDDKSNHIVGENQVLSSPLLILQFQNSSRVLNGKHMRSYSCNTSSYKSNIILLMKLYRHGENMAVMRRRKPK